MIDFRKKDLYKREKVRMHNFLKYKLVTNSEQEENEMKATLGVDDPLEAGDLFEGEAFELGGEDGGILSGIEEGGFGDAGERSGVKDAVDWQQDNPIKTFFMSPLFMLKYVFIDITQDAPKKGEWKHIIKVLNNINIISVLTTLIFLLLGVKTIFSPTFQLIVGMILFITTTLIIYFVYEEDTKTIEIIKELLGKGTETQEKDNAEEDGLVNFEFDEMEPFGVGLEDSLDEGGSDNLADEKESNLMEGLDFGDGYEEVEDFSEETDESGLRDSFIRTDTDDEFGEGLLEAFARSDRYKGKTILERGKLLRSFSDYLIQNDRSFGSWKRPKERGTEYNNIAYALFKGLSLIETRFGQYDEENIEDSDKMVVLDIRKSPLLYRIELELPEYFKEKKIQANIGVIEDVLRKAEDDFEVSVIVTTFQGNIVIKLLRLDNKNLVSLGDILRFKDEDRGYVGLEAFDNPDYGLPILFGLQNNENPYVIDWEANTMGVIVGGSGSGKSWATFEMMLNFIISNDYNNVQFVVLDAKNAPFWNAFAKLPHVLGYHSDTSEYLDILIEVEEERKRRQELLQELGAEDMKGYRKKLRKEGRHEELKEVPLLFLIIDEITATMLELREKDEDLFKSFGNMLGQISTRGRSAGVRILSIGQRSTYESVPKVLMANSSFKFGMKMDNANDFPVMFGKEVEKMNYPSTLGVGLSKTEGNMNIQNIKTLTIGGENETQMLMLIRTLAFDWIRRSHGVDNIKDMPRELPFELAYNRDKFYLESIEEMKEGRILNTRKVNKGYEVDLSEDVKETAGYKIDKVQDRIEYTEKRKLDKGKETLDKDDVEDSLSENYVGIESEQSLGEMGNDKKEEENNNEALDIISNITDGDFNGLENRNTIEKENEFNEEEDYLEENKRNISENGDTDFNLDNRYDDLVNIHKTNTEDIDVEIEEDIEGSDWDLSDIGISIEEEYEDTDGGILSKGNDDILDVENEEENHSKSVEQYESKDSLNSAIKPNIRNNEKSNSYEKDIDTFINNRYPDLGNIIRRQESTTLESSQEETESAPTLLSLLGAEEEIVEITNEKEQGISEELKKDTGNNEIRNKEDDTLKEDLYERKRIDYEEKQNKLNKRQQVLDKIRNSSAEIKEEIENNNVSKKERKSKIRENVKSEEQTRKDKEEYKKEEVKDEEEQKVSKAKKLKGLKREEQRDVNKKQTGTVELRFESANQDKIEEPNVSIKEYIAKYGKSKGFNIYMEKEEIQSVYSKRKIVNALDRLIMVEAGKYYVVRI